MNITEKARRTIIAEILLGLIQMHKMSIAHRDIKPENILLNSKNRMKICDFGQAKKFSIEALAEMAVALDKPDLLNVPNETSVTLGSSEGSSLF